MFEVEYLAKIGLVRKKYESIEEAENKIKTLSSIGFQFTKLTKNENGRTIILKKNEKVPETENIKIPWK
jgi:hypothetical protein